MNDDRALAEVKQVTGIDDLSDISFEQFAEIEKLAGEGTLDIEHVAILPRVIGNFVELQEQSVENLKAVVQGARDTQVVALGVVGRSLDAQSRTLTQLAQSAETDETRLELAKLTIEIGRMGIEVANIIAGMNRDNNEAWKKVAAALGAAAVAAVVIFSGGRIRGRQG